MKRFAAIANGGASHQMSMCAISRELQKLGHEVVLYGTRRQHHQLRACDIHFETIGANRVDPVQVFFERTLEAQAVPISASIEYMKSMADLLCTELPSRFRQDRIEFVLADQEEPGAATAADITGTPYASICSSLPLNEAADVPPSFLDWHYSPGLFARCRNHFGYRVRNVLVGSVNRLLNGYRRAAGLPPYRKPDDSFSKRIQISQLIRDFDFPRTTLPPGFHYVGPFQRQPLSNVEFPFERLDGRPLIYASFGTTFGDRHDSLRAIAAACAPLPAQLVISLGGSRLAADEEPFPGSPVVVPYAPQLDLLSRSTLVITHAGLNTTLEALSKGVPLLAMPIAGDQFGVSCRLVWCHVGRVLLRREQSVDGIRAAVSSMLADPESKAAARNMAAAIQQSGGAAQAAAILHSASC